MWSPGGEDHGSGDRLGCGLEQGHWHIGAAASSSCRGGLELDWGMGPLMCSSRCACPESPSCPAHWQLGGPTQVWDRCVVPGVRHPATAKFVRSETASRSMEVLVKAADQKVGEPEVWEGCLSVWSQCSSRGLDGVRRQLCKGSEAGEQTEGRHSGMAVWVCGVSPSVAPHAIRVSPSQGCSILADIMACPAFAKAMIFPTLGKDTYQSITPTSEQAEPH